MTTNQPLLVGVDLGTTNIKTLVFKPDGTIVAESSLPTPTHYPRPGWAYFDPDELWQGVVSALRQAISQLQEPQQIVSVAVSSFAETGVSLDAHGQPTHNAIAWFDTRTEAQLAWLETHIGADRLYEITGLPPLVIYSMCKLLWLKENAPDAFARTAHWLNGADFIAYQLCGVPATDYSLASRMLAMDIQGRYWADDFLREIGISPDILAPLTASGTPLGKIRSEVAHATGLPAHTQVAVGGHDHVCGAFALGINRPGKLLNSMGTAEAIFAPVAAPLTDPVVGQQGYSQGLLGVQDDAYYYVLGGMYTSGGSVEWLREIISGTDNSDDQVDYATLIREANVVPPGSLGVGFLSYLRLASCPYVDSKARGAFIGLSTDVKRGTLFRAVLEGLSYEVRLSLETLLEHQAASHVPDIYATGGGTRNPLWMQIKASILNQAITIVDVAEAVTLGAAMMGGLGAGVYSDIVVALESVKYTQRRIEPNSSHIADYEAYYQRVYRQLYPTLQSIHHMIHEWASQSET